jgi:hypothetical protein
MSKLHEGTGLVFRKRDVIGANDAEDDAEWLKQCFVDNGHLRALRDVRDPKRIILGRTGTGKTALLITLKERVEHVVEVDPAKMSLAYVSNAPILTTLRAAGVNLAFFYKLLWKHCFCVELLRLHFGKQSWFAELRAHLTNADHQRALDYLAEFGDSFFDYDDVRVRTIVQKVEDKLDGEIGAGIGDFKARVAAGESFSSEERAEIARKAQRVLPDSHRQELAQIVDVVNSVLSDPKRPFYLLVDKIDENWVQESEKLPLIMALLETVREFRTIENAKVIVATRIDLLRRVFDTCQVPGFQEEKYESLFLRLSWSDAQLLQLLETRVNFTFRDRYSASRALGLADLFQTADGSHFRPSEFILERTFRRPRDVISFFNYCMEASEGATVITKQRAEAAEKEYSESRLRSLRDEWADTFRAVNSLARILLDKRPSSFRLGEVTLSEIRERCTDFAVSYAESTWPDGIHAGSQDDVGARHFQRKGMAILCHIGVVSLKLRADDRAASGPEHRIDELIPLLTEETRVVVHPMVFRALHIVPVAS